jgi:hypothetical protein
MSKTFLEAFMAGKKYESCLAPFENEILDLRRKRPPVSFPKIAEYLKEKHQISVRRQTIETFLKIRARGFKTCKYVAAIEQLNAVNPPAAESVLQTHTPPVVLNEPKPRIAKTEVKEVSVQSVKEKPKERKEPDEVIKTRDQEETVVGSNPYLIPVSGLGRGRIQVLELLQWLAALPIFHAKPSRRVQRG